MRASYDNWFDDYTPSFTTEDANYPGTNVQDERLAKVWRSTAVAAAQYATIDAGAGNTLNPTCCFVFATNVTAAGTISIQGSDDDFSTTPEDFEMTRLTEDIYAKFFTSSAARRYWRFEVDDATNTDGYIELGRVWLSDYIDFTLAAANNFQNHYIDTTETQGSMGGQTYSDEGDVINHFNFNFPWWEWSDLSTLKTFFEAVKTAYPWVFIFDEDAMTNVMPLYCKFERYPQLNHIYNLTFNGAITIREEK